MAQLKRIARSKSVPGVGYARRGVIHTVPDEMEKDLLATGEWEKVGKETTQERVTEPAPAVGDLTVKQLRERLTALDVSVPDGARKDDLIQLLGAHNAN